VGIVASVPNNGSARPKQTLSIIAHFLNRAFVEARGSYAAQGQEGFISSQLMWCLLHFDLVICVLIATLLKIIAVVSVAIASVIGYTINGQTTGSETCSTQDPTSSGFIKCKETFRREVTKGIQNRYFFIEYYLIFLFVLFITEINITTRCHPTTCGSGCSNTSTSTNTSSELGFALIIAATVIATSWCWWWCIILVVAQIVCRLLLLVVITINQLLLFFLFLFYNAAAFFMLLLSCCLSRYNANLPWW